MRDGKSPALSLCRFSASLAGLVPVELGASEGFRQRGRDEKGGQGKGSAPAWDVPDSAGFAGGGWEQQSKLSVTAHSSLENSPPSRRTLEGSRVGPVLRLPGLRGLCGMRDAPERGPSPADPPPQMSLPAKKNVPSAVKPGAPRCHGHWRAVPQVPPEGVHVPNASGRGQRRFGESGSCSLHPASASRGGLSTHANPKPPWGVRTGSFQALLGSPGMFLIEGEQAGDTGSQQVAFHLRGGTPPLPVSPTLTAPALLYPPCWGAGDDFRGARVGQTTGTSCYGVMGT